MMSREIYAHDGARGPRVVALGGGHGLYASLSALKILTRNVTAIVTVGDDGGSSGRLRAELGGLPPGDFPLPIFDMVLEGITVRGSIVGTRLDLAESLDFAGRGLVHAHTATARLEDINSVFDKMIAGNIDGRIVLDFA